MVMQGGKSPGVTKHATDWLAKAATPRMAMKMPRAIKTTPELVVLLIRNFSRKARSIYYGASIV